MRKLFVVPLVLILGIALSAQDVLAQRRSTSGPSLRKNNRPTTSPYLDLLDQGAGRGGIGFQYFRRVRPEVELRNQNSQLQGSLDSLQKQMNQQQLQLKQSSASQLSPSGHTATFLSYGNYFSFPGRR